MMNFWRKRGSTLTSSTYKQKVTRWQRQSKYRLIVLTLGLLIISGCASAPPAAAPTTTPMAMEATTAPTIPAETEPTAAAPDVSTTTGEPQALRILSPQTTGAEVFPSPTPRSAMPVVSSDRLVTTLPAAIALEQGSITGNLSASAGLFYDKTYFDLYEFQGEIGQLVSLNLQSDVFDTNLILIDPDGNVVEMNDDYEKASTHSRLLLPLPMSGTYQVLVNSFEVVEGAYTLDFAVQATANTDTLLTMNTPVQGWLYPGDEIDAQGLLYDEWQLEMPAAATVIWAESTQFDPKLEAFDPLSAPLLHNGDRDIVGSDFDAWLALMPSDQTPPGTLLTIRVTLQGEFAQGGEYSLQALPMPTDYSRKGTITVRPVIVKGADGQLGSDATEAQVRASIEHSNALWQQCGLDVVIENDEIQTISVPGLEYTVQIETPGQEWTIEEDLLMFHPTHALPDSGVITLYFVRDADARTGIAYPTTRYSPQRGGLIIIADTGVTDDRAFSGTVAHEIGHILGLNHPDLEDGDGWNDTAPNIMFAGVGVDIESPLSTEEIAMLYSSATDIQCVVARAAPHYVSSADGESLVPPEFQRTDRILLPGTTIEGTLTTRDALASEEGEQFLDVYYFHGKEGETFTISLASEAFDAFLLLEDQNGEIIDMADDSAAGTDAELTFTIPETGDYLIGVTSLVRSTGAYTLSLDGGAGE